MTWKQLFDLKLFNARMSIFYEEYISLPLISSYDHEGMLDFWDRDNQIILLVWKPKRFAMAPSAKKRFIEMLIDSRTCSPFLVRKNTIAFVVPSPPKPHFGLIDCSYLLRGYDLGPRI